MLADRNLRTVCRTERARRAIQIGGTCDTSPAGDVDLEQESDKAPLITLSDGTRDEPAGCGGDARVGFGGRGEIPSGSRIPPGRGFGWKAMPNSDELKKVPAGRSGDGSARCDYSRVDHRAALSA